MAAPPVPGRQYPGGRSGRAVAALLGSVSLLALPFGGESAQVLREDTAVAPSSLNRCVTLLQHRTKTSVISVIDDESEKTSVIDDESGKDHRNASLIELQEKTTVGNTTVLREGIGYLPKRSTEEERGVGARPATLMQHEDTMLHRSLAYMLTKGETFWHGDIFDEPNITAKLLLDSILTNGGDWAILGVAVLVLLFLDFFVLQPLVIRCAGVSPRSQASETVLRQAFEQCDVEGKGSASKEDLVRACKGMVAEEQVRSLTVVQGAAVTWEEFRSHCRSESLGTKDPASANSMMGHIAMLVFWVLMGVVFNGIIWARRGQEAAIHWLTGYLLEWLLSLDNIFIFHLIFRTYATPRVLLHKALFMGILGAVVFRMLFFMALTSLLHLVSWVRIVFGVLLIYSGVQAAREDDEEQDITNLWAVRMLKKCLGSRLVESYDLRNHNCFVRGSDGKLKVTLLLLVVMCLEIVDIFFAVDSVSAKVAQIPDYFLSYSSSIIAIFGLRAMFFVVQDMVDSFDLLKYGLCFILVFIGIELIISDWVQLPAQVVCVVILSVFVVGIAGSVAQHLINEQKDREPEAAVGGI